MVSMARPSRRVRASATTMRYWLGVGALPTEPVEQLLKITGDWQKHKGLEGAEGTLRTAEPKPSKLDLFNKALEDAQGEPSAEAITAKRKAEKAKKDEAKKAEQDAAKAAESGEGEAASADAETAEA